MYVLCNSKEVQSLQKLQSQSNTSTTELLFKIVFLTKAQGKKDIFGSSFKTCLEELKKNLILFLSQILGWKIIGFKNLLTDLVR